MKKLKWIVELSVDQSWIADGFNLTKERAHSMLAHDLCYAYDYELKAKIISAPSDKEIAKLQGFKSIKAMKEGVSA